MLASQSKKKSTRLRSGYVRDVMPRCNCPPISSAEVNTVSNMSMSEPSTLFRLFRSPGNRRDSSRASSRNVSHVRTYCRAEGPTALRKRMLRRYAENKGPTKYGLFRKRNRLSASCCSLYSRSTFGMGKFLPYRSTAEGRWTVDETRQRSASCLCLRLLHLRCKSACVAVLLERAPPEAWESSGRTI